MIEKKQKKGRQSQTKGRGKQTVQDKEGEEPRGCGLPLSKWQGPISQLDVRISEFTERPKPQ